MTLLKRYFWRSVLLPSLAIVAIIVGLDCLFSFIYELEFLRGGYQVRMPNSSGRSTRSTAPRPSSPAAPASAP